MPSASIADTGATARVPPGERLFALTRRRLSDNLPFMLETPPRPRAKRKLRDVVVDRLKAYIAEEGLEPGDRLPTEGALAERFGVSRLSLREATKALEILGIIESKTGVGLTLGTVSLERLAGHLGFHPSLHQAGDRQLIESRIVLETGVLPYSARRMAAEPAVRARLVELAESFRETRDLEEWIALDIAFHRALLEASGLTPLVAFGDLLQAFFQRFRESVKRAEWQHGIESHLKIIDLLGKGDVARATTELRRHIGSHGRRVRRRS